jgi:HPt (histidine-containing phosphotransfer) domain-containing protein
MQKRSFDMPRMSVKALFYDEMQKRVKELSDPQKIVSTLHTMKGSAAIMQCERLKMFLSDLHISCKFHGHELTDSDFQHLDEMLRDQIK